MLARTDNSAAIAQEWLARFDRALAGGGALAGLFVADSYWRDVLALTWTIETVHGADAIVERLQAPAGRAKPSGFCLAAHRTAPRQVTRAGVAAIEAFFDFETAEGRGSGIVRLVGEQDGAKAWTLLTALDELKGFEEATGRSRPTGSAWSRDFRGPNWLDKRRA